MALIQFGSRGPEVFELQANLNSRPSRLPRLPVDGIFGNKTQARVVEFQRDNGLDADGVVGHLTNAKLRSGPVPPPTNLNALLHVLAGYLEPPERASFLNMAQPLIATPFRQAGLSVSAAPAIGIGLVLLFLLLMFMFVILSNSHSKANQEAARELDRKVRELRERFRSHPDEAPALQAEALETAQKSAQGLLDRAKAEQNKCFEKFTPQELALKRKICSKLIMDVAVAMQSLAQRLKLSPSGGFRPEDLVKGIANGAAALIEALRALANCMGCDNLLF